MPDENVVVLNDGLERRTKPSGKARYTMTVKTDPLIHNFDPKALGRGPAEAIAQLLREKIEGITATVSAGSKRFRANAAKAFEKGESWAVKSWSGGRIGAMPPNQTDRQFNNSGRLAKSIRVGVKDSGYTVNVASNRWDPSQFKDGEAGVVRVWSKLVQLVPEMANPAAVMADSKVGKAVENSYRMLIVKAQATGDKLSEARIRAMMSAARRILGTFLELAA